MLYVPHIVVRFVRRRFDESKNKELVSALVSARYPATPAEFLALSLFYSSLAAVPGALMGYLISLLISPQLVGIAIDHLKWSVAFAIVFAALAFFTTRYLILSYPFYLSNLRRGRIEAALPNAVNTMLGMAKGGVSLEAIFKFVAENRHIFDELSKEFEKIVTLIEMFDYDLVSAVRYVADTTPSEKLRTFLDNLVNVYEGGGDVVEYLRSKSEQYLSEREATYSVLFETLQIFAEIYLALFIVAPLFFLVVLVVFQMIGSGVLENFKLAIYIIIPAGSLLMIALMKSAMPAERRAITEVEREYEEVDARISDTAPEFRINKFKRALNSVKSFLLQPFRETPYTLTLRAILFYILLPPVAFFVLAHDKLALDIVLFISTVSLIAPAIVFVEYRNYLMRKMEKELPDFLRQLASLNEAGLNIVEALRHISEAELGVLGREVKLTKREIEWGELVTSAFRKLEKRVRSDIFARVMSTLVKAIEATPNIKEALVIASTYSELEVAAMEKIRNQTFMYTIIIYLAFAVFLYTSYVLINNLLSVVASMNVSAGTMSIGIDIDLVKRTFFETSLLVAFFSGLVAGVIGEGKVESGLKHVLILLVIVYAFFRFVLP